MSNQQISAPADAAVAEGPFLRLRGLRLSDLPPPDAGVDRVQPFVLALLQEAKNIIESVDDHYAHPASDTVWKNKGTKTYRGRDQTGGLVDIDVDLLASSVVNEPEQVQALGSFPMPVPPSPDEDAADDDAAADDAAADGNEAGVPDDAGPPSAAQPSAAQPSAAQPNAGPADSTPGNTNADAGAQAGRRRHRLRRTLRTKRQGDAPETWACRRSKHANSATPGAASWAEFGIYMKDQHVQTEKDMTATVVEAQTVLEWPSARLVPVCDLRDIDNGRGPWTDFTLAVVEMQHDLKSWPLRHRVFPVLQMTCRSISTASPPEIFVVSVPISEWKAYPCPAGVAKKLGDSSNVILGSYASVELFRLFQGTVDRGRPLAKAGKKGAAVVSAAAAPPAGGDEPTPAASQPPSTHVEWIMATASHARGVLPLFLQTPFVPVKIADDVPFFTKWLAGKRSQSEVPQASNGIPQQPGSQAPSSQENAPANDAPPNQEDAPANDAPPSGASDNQSGTNAPPV